MIKKLVKFPKNLTNKKIENFFFYNGLSKVIKLYKGKYQSVHDMELNHPYNMELRDWHNLYRLFQFVVLNKRITILEFGSGWSSLVLQAALNENKNRYLNYVKDNLRRNNLFELFVVVFSFFCFSSNNKSNNQWNTKKKEYFNHSRYTFPF